MVLSILLVIFNILVEVWVLCLFILSVIKLLVRCVEVDVEFNDVFVVLVLVVIGWVGVIVFLVVCWVIFDVVCEILLLVFCKLYWVVVNVEFVFKLLIFVIYYF